MLMIIIVFFRKHESNSWIFLFILKKIHLTQCAPWPMM